MVRNRARISWCFNPRLRVGGDYLRSLYDFLSAVFQSTPPRGRRPQIERQRLLAERVSIHASAWEATSNWRRVVSTRAVSIHASAWEATKAKIVSKASDRFQSTPPRGRRQQGLIAGIKLGVFQSTPPRGRRLRNRYALWWRSWFQSTPPRGRRLDGQYRDTQDQKFQSTPPRGRRLRSNAMRKVYNQVSIHASAWEATRLGGNLAAFPIGFNPRLRVGGDNSTVACTTSFLVSIHASAWEATTFSTSALEILRGFNPRLRVGGDWRRWCLHPSQGVSIHASAWEATNNIALIELL